MCDVVTVIEKGRILANGTVRDVLERVRTRRRLSVRIAGPSESLERFLLEQPGVTSVHEAGERVQFELDGGDEDQVATRRSPRGRRVSGARGQRSQRRTRGSLHRAHEGRGPVSASARLLQWLADTSDRLSPLVVKEVRQLVRGREFVLAFSASLLVGLTVAGLGAAAALGGSNTSGRWTFALLMGGLALLGLAVVPLGAFSALRHERLEQTLDLITLTSLSPRRIVDRQAAWRRW